MAASPSRPSALTSAPCGETGWGWRVGPRLNHPVKVWQLVVRRCRCVAPPAPGSASGLGFRLSPSPG
eukprot:8729451-Alexandrium_andersonii.AAC.1